MKEREFFRAPRIFCQIWYTEKNKIGVVDVRLACNDFKITTQQELSDTRAKLDAYGLGAIALKASFLDESWTIEDCQALGERVAKAGLVIGEFGYWDNIMHPNPEEREHNFQMLCKTMRQAEAVGARSVITLPGTLNAVHPYYGFHPYNWSEGFKTELRALILRMLDTVKPKNVKYLLEGWSHCFLYDFEQAAAFHRSIDHENYGIHVDIVNYVTPMNLHNTTQLINDVFNEYGPRIVSCHTKDIEWVPEDPLVHMRECICGTGLLDYDTYIKKIASLPFDVTCYCEQRPSLEDYVMNFVNLHYIAKKNGLAFTPRQPK